MKNIKQTLLTVALDTYHRDKKMKNFFKIAPIMVFVLVFLASCGSGGLDGTYVACNDAAKQNYFAKFEFQPEEEFNLFDKVFKKNTVKVYMGMMGIAMPMAYEYRYSLKGSKLLIEGGIPGVDGGSIELTYNKERDEISLDIYDELGSIAQQIGDHHDQREEINAQLEHRREKKVDINANQVSQGLKQLDVAPVWSKEGISCDRN